MTNTSQLALDVLIQIFSSVPPRDVILGARQVCSNWNNASTNISLWKALLRRVCFENTIPPLIFPDEMALKDLEHAATSPARFLAILGSSCEQDKPLKVYSQHYIDTDLLRDIPVFTETVSAVYLIPGGRYLVTQHEGSTSEIHFWDLEVPGHAEGFSSDIMPLASLDDRSFLTSQPAHLTRDGKGMIIFTSKDSDTEEENEKDIFVYEIYPTLETPSFFQISAHSHTVSTYDTQSPSYAFDDQRLAIFTSKDTLRVFTNKDTVRVWNFVAGLEATWSTTRYPMNSDITKVFFQGNAVVILNHNLVSAFTIPELHASGSSAAEDIPYLDPFFHAELPVIAHLTPQFEVESPGSWYSKSNAPMNIDSLFYSEDQNNQNGAQPATRYRLHVSTEIAERLANPNESRPSNKTFGFTTLPADIGIAQEYRICENRMISYWSFDNGLAIRSAPLDESSLEPAEIVVTVHRSPTNSHNLVSLCPVSGRAVHCHAERLLIEIVDFLPHPTSKSEPLPDYESDSD